MEVKEGDVLVCQCEDCDMELTVTKACRQGSCGSCMDIEATCCDLPMVKR
ncbi:MAG: hypothetical protein ACP5KN_17550 [Armatimonadota bacterium]